ncbi:MAG TPA: non-homologous end-joining DNA ligase [Acidimicrobiia bacterium]|nr:non-homologous end-joining DNA ligase [Acidimicrobiia bacterium]
MVEVTNPDKVLFPEDGITKGQVIEYYRAVAEAMVPHLQGRPLTLQRFPNGIAESGFMQKNASKHFPDSIERVEVPKEGGTTNHPLCGSADDLLYLANQGTITFHIWTSRLPELGKPDRLILDLDPADGAEPPRDGAHAARAVMEEIGLSPGLMTTGSSGYHIIAIIDPVHDFEAVGRTSRLLAEILAARHPETLTTEFLKKERRGRVFVDWLRNRWAQSAVSPWSVRPRAAAPVAMPITWDELDQTDPQRWTVADAPTRVEQDDPWPPKSRLDLEAVEELAAAHDVSADEPFDRFGRKQA